jgi:hypothetical protein
LGEAEEAGEVASLKLQAHLDTGTPLLTPMEIDGTKTDGRDNVISGRIVDQALRLLFRVKRYRINLQKEGTFTATLDAKPREADPRRGS